MKYVAMYHCATVPRGWGSNGLFTPDISVNAAIVASSNALIKLLKFLNKPSESLQKYVAATIDHL